MIRNPQNGIGNCLGPYIKYSKLKEQCALPEHIVNLVENQSKKATSSRQAKAMAINRLFKRDAEGTMSLCMSDGLLRESQEVFSQTYNRRESPPEVVYLWPFPRAPVTCIVGY